MLKFTIYLTKVAITLALTLLFASCKGNFNIGSIKGDGNVTKETRNISGDFSRIESHSGLEVVIEISKTISVVVEADANLQKHITTKVKDGVLIIEADGNIDSDSKTVTVKMPVVDDITAASASSVTCKQIIKNKSIHLQTSSAAEIEVTIEADNIVCETSSGSNISVNGMGLNLETASSSGSEIDARKLMVNNVTAQASSGSETRVHPAVSLNAQASSGASIVFYNSPKTISKKESSGGSIAQE
jgi:hypothetical protein